MAKSKARFTPPSKTPNFVLPEKKQIDHGFLVSFAHLDCQNQGAKVEEIEKIEELSHLINLFHGFQSETITQLQTRLGRGKFCTYGDFPKRDITDYTHPRHVPQDAQWARIHVTGKYCAVGHVVNSVFYLVFLDKDHKFWKSTLKHT